jgi:hypothetical protein
VGFVGSFRIAWSSDVINRRKDETLITRWTTISPIKDQQRVVISFAAMMPDQSYMKLWRTIAQSVSTGVDGTRKYDGLILHMNIDGGAFNQVRPLRPKVEAAYMGARILLS